ncbi:hypothetical protein DFH28DRAFT_967534, partial [Melampsora americana]
KLESLPERKQGKGPMPAFFFVNPGIYFPSEQLDRPALQGVNGPLHQSLKDFGPALLRKYNPSAIGTFSAHCEAKGEMLVTDYGNNQQVTSTIVLFEYLQPQQQHV